MNLLTADQYILIASIERLLVPLVFFYLIWVLGTLRNKVQEKGWKLALLFTQWSLAVLAVGMLAQAAWSWAYLLYAQTPN